jgi:uncharacterized protein YbbK (DUF523 family)
VGIISLFIFPACPTPYDIIFINRFTRMHQEVMMMIVSACLIGINCKYSGGHNYRDTIALLVRDGKAIPVCPEQLGGLETPRPPVELVGGDGAGVLDGKCRAMTHDGNDRTGAFIRGAEETLTIARLCGAECAILKAKSPSCGFGKIYDGSFTGKLREGNGVTAELLARNGINVSTHN